jgi:4-aminobutyrate aminotransferase
MFVSGIFQFLSEVSFMHLKYEKLPDIRYEPPGPKARELIARDHRVIATSTKCSPVVAVEGDGVVIKDIDGNLYIDFTTGIGVTNLGHCHPQVVNAIQHQAEKLMHFAGTDFYYEVQVLLAEKLCKITPGRFDKKVFFTNSGAEAIEAGIKLTKMATERKQFIAFINSFHGRTAGAGSLTASKVVQRNKFFPLMPGVTHIPYAYCYRCPYKQTYPECDIWCAKIIEELYFQTCLPPDEVGAMFIEPVQGEGGYIVPPVEFIQILKRIADKYNILLVDDDIQTGFGRTGKMFGIEHFGIEPEIIALAKGMGSGIPVGATVFDAKIDFQVKGAHSNTYGGNLIACASALATIEIIERDELVTHAARMGTYFRKRLDELQAVHELIGDVRSLGLMLATEFVKDRTTKQPAIEARDKILELAYKRGLILLPTGRSAIRYIPPLIVTEEHIDKAVEIIDVCIKAVTC